jgi:drug/metabolite transporter (DMT)-like permease
MANTIYSVKTINYLLHPLVQILFGAFIISFSAIFVRLADVPPSSSGFYRVFFGFLFLFTIASAKKHLVKISKRQLFFIVICGLAFALDLFFWHESILRVGPGLATLLGNFQVFLLTIVAICFLREKVRSRFLIALPLAIFGLFLLIGIDWQHLPDTYKNGVIFGLLTALCYSVYLLCLKNIQTGLDHSPVFSLMLVSFFCSVFLGLKMTIYGDTFVIPNLKSLMALLGLGFFSQTLGWMLISSALPKLATSLTGLVLLLQPFLSFLWDVFFFSRPTSIINWLGVIIALLGIYLGVTSKATETA